MTTNLQTAVLPENEGAAQVWNAGGYEYNQISRQISDAIEHCVDRLAPQPNERILDVATGTGWTARRIAERGSRVCGVDFSQHAIETALRLNPTDNINFQIGDAEALPFASNSFDAVVSTFGVMFCANPQQAADELARVCRPRGRLALATWEAKGGVFDMFQVVNAYKPPPAPGTANPFDWSNEERLESWLGKDFELRVERATSYYRTESPDQAWTAFADGYGPLKSLLTKLDDQESSALRRDWDEFHLKHETPMGILVPRPYTIVTGVRR